MHNNQRMAVESERGVFSCVRLRVRVFSGSCLLVLILAGVGFWMRAQLEPWVAKMIYPSLWGTFLLVGAALCKDLSGRDRDVWKLLRPWLWPVCIGLALTGICFLSVGPGFRVLADETNQVEASLSFYLDRTLKLVTDGENYYGSFHTLLVQPTHRGGLFPFCICLLHTLFGYNGYHGFVVNFVASVLTLATVVRFGQKVFDHTYGVMAAVLLVSFPLYSLVATSSAYEALNTLLIALVFYQLHRVVEKPDWLRLETLLLLAVLASQCRYETALLIMPVAVAWFWKRKALIDTKPSWRLAFIPLLYLPLIWQRIAMGGYMLGDATLGPSAFSLSYVWGNALDGLDFFVNPTLKNYPSSPLMFGLALAGIYLLIKTWLAQDKAFPLRPAYCGLVGLGLGGIALVHLLYGWNDMRLPASMRFAASYLPVMSIVAAYPVYRLWEKPVMVGPLLVGLVCLLSVGLCTAAKNERGNTLTLSREYKRNLDFLKAYPKEGTLVIADRPGMYAAHLYGAVRSSYANTQANRILRNYERHLYSSILVIQNVNYKDQEVAPKLDQKYVLMPVHEYQNGSDNYVRISRVLTSSEKLHSAALQSLSSGANSTIRPVSLLDPSSLSSSPLSAGSRASDVSSTTEMASESREAEKARGEYVEAHKRYMEALRKAMERVTNGGQRTEAGNQK